MFFNKYDQEWGLADMDFASTSTDAPIGIAQGAGTDNNAITNGILILGLDTTQIGMTGGSDIYLSSTAGATTTDAQVLVLGRAKDGDELYFNPFVNYTASANEWLGLQTFDKETITGHAQVEVVTFTTSGTWTKDPGLEYIVVETIGGGGGGSAGNPNSTGGAGGGSGGYSRELILASSLSATTTVTIGAGGSAGNNGSASLFASYLSANGGIAAVAGAPGDGGTATGGDINFRGNPGNSGGDSERGGAGGSSFFGGAGRGGYPSSTNPTNALANSGSGGAGGGESAGSSGGSGIVIVTEYY